MPPRTATTHCNGTSLFCGMGHFYFALTDNLFDKKYYASSYAALWVQPGVPRSFTIRGTFTF